MNRKEPIRYRAQAQVMHLGEPYDGMVPRVHDRVLEMLVPAHAGNRQGTLVCAKRVLAQCSALVELLEGKLEDEKERNND